MSYVQSVVDRRSLLSVSAVVVLHFAGAPHRRTEYRTQGASEKCGC